MTIDIANQKLRPGGTGPKKNPEHILYGNKDGQIEFGHLHLSNSGEPSGDVTAGVYLQAYDSRHYMSMDIDGVRNGWTSFRSPGPHQIWCASDHAGKQNTSISNNWAGVGFFLLAENGDIIIRAPKGRIRMSALDIDIRAEGPDLTRGSVNIDSNESVNIKTGNFDVKAQKGVNMFTPKTLQLVANTGFRILGNFGGGLTAASEWKSDKLNALTKVAFFSRNFYLF